MKNYGRVDTGQIGTSASGMMVVVGAAEVSDGNVAYDYLILPHLSVSVIRQRLQANPFKGAHRSSS